MHALAGMSLSVLFMILQRSCNILKGQGRNVAFDLYYVIGIFLYVRKPHLLFLEDMAFSVEFNSWYGKFALLIIFEII